MSSQRKLPDYPKIYRLPIPNFPTTRGRHYLTEQEAESLCTGRVVIEEKIDGKLGVEYHKEYPESYLFYEFMKYRHTIPYTKLPAWKIYFDQWLFYEEEFADIGVKKATFDILGVPMVRRIYYGQMEGFQELLKYLDRILKYQSVYGEHQIEGIVIKNYPRQLFGKVVNPEFEEDMDSAGHWMKRPKERNRLG